MVVIEYAEYPKSEHGQRHLHKVDVSGFKQRSTKDVVRALRKSPEHGPFVAGVKAEKLRGLLRQLRAGFHAHSSKGHSQDSRTGWQEEVVCQFATVPGEGKEVDAWPLEEACTETRRTVQMAEALEAQLVSLRQELARAPAECDVMQQAAMGLRCPETSFWACAEYEVMRQECEVEPRRWVTAADAAAAGGAPASPRPGSTTGNGADLAANDGGQPPCQLVPPSSLTTSVDGGRSAAVPAAVAEELPQPPPPSSLPAFWKDNDCRGAAAAAAADAKELPVMLATGGAEDEQDEKQDEEAEEVEEEKLGARREDEEGHDCPAFDIAGTLPDAAAHGATDCHPQPAARSFGGAVSIGGGAARCGSPPPLPSAEQVADMHAEALSAPLHVDTEGAIGSWPSGAWARWSLAAGGIEEACETYEFQDLFEAFRVSRGVEAVARSFARLLRASIRASGGEGGYVTSSSASCSAVDGATGEDGLGCQQPLDDPLDVIRRTVGGRRRLASVLWERLEARRSSDECRGRPLACQRVVVVGGGPVGLRCALQLRTLGAEVVVLERRSSFDRINRLHLWPWCCEDLKGWGAKVLEPPELSFGADPQFLHIGCAELQTLLLKACLLLGVEVFFGAKFLGSRPVPADVPEVGCPLWEVLVQGTATVAAGQAPAQLPGPHAPERLRGVTVVVGADGPHSSSSGGSVASLHGLRLQYGGGLRKDGASLGIVANYQNRHLPAEKGRRPFSLARQFYDELFRECESQTGVALENIVCFISPQTYYFVMTPTRRSLQQLGVLSPNAACDGDVLQSLDRAALARAARAVVAFPWKPDEPLLLEETLASPMGAPSLFDFSRQWRAVSGVRVIDSAVTSLGASTGGGGGGGGGGGCNPARLFVGLCGDSLLEPFWPEGLGVVRGFFAALDLASTVCVWAKTGDATTAAAHFEAAFRQLKSLAAKTRNTVLCENIGSYNIDPATRYRSFMGAEG